MWCRKADEFTGCDDLGFLPEHWKMLLISRNEVICTGSIGAFEEHIVVRITSHFKAARRSNHVTAIFDELQQLQTNAPANAKLRAGENVCIFFQNGPRHVEASGLGNGQQERSALKTLRLKSSRKN